MRDSWLERYRNASGRADTTRDALLGFNANIDVVFDLEELDLELDVEPEEKEKVSSLKGMKSVLRHCVENGENREVEVGEIDHSFSGGEERIGGQAGIMSNFLASLGNGVIFYTPFLSQELADMMDERILYPVHEDELVLKNVGDASNTDRTKKNLIFEYDEETTGRVIFSSTMKGFGPYFRKGVEDNFDIIEENTDRIILSGFHDAEGNREAKLKKSRNQIRELEKPVHLEYVHRNDEFCELLTEYIVPSVDSIGLDGDELESLASALEIEQRPEEMSLGEVFHASRSILERFDLSRVHVHTYDFHVCVVEEDYPVSSNDIRDAMLFGELCAIKYAELGRMPGREDLENLEMDGKHLNGFEHLEHFGDFFGLDEFRNRGTARIEGCRVVAIPTIIDEDPEKLVGLGDIISAGSFLGEIN